MAKTSSISVALRGAAVAGLLFVSVVPTEAAGPWSQRFAFLQNTSTQSFSFTSFTRPPYLGYRIDRLLSRLFGRPVSPFCRIFC